MEANTESMFIKSDSFDFDAPEAPNIIPFTAGTFPALTKLNGPSYFFMSVMHSSSNLIDVGINSRDRFMDVSLQSLRSLSRIKALEYFNVPITPRKLREIAPYIQELTELTCYEPVSRCRWILCLTKQLKQANIFRIQNDRGTGQFSKTTNFEKSRYFSFPLFCTRGPGS